MQDNQPTITAEDLSVIAATARFAHAAVDAGLTVADFAPLSLPEEGTTATEETPIEDRFAIDSEKRAEWLLRHLANIEAEKARVKAQADKRVKELAADYAALMGRFGAELQAWAKGESLRRRRQTVMLSQGTLAFENRAARLVIGDQADALTTAKLVCPAAVTTETVERFDAQAYLKYAEGQAVATGEVLPGTVWEEAGEAFFVRVKPGFTGLPKGGKE